MSWKAEPQAKTPERTPLVSSPLCQTPRTIPQVAKGTDFRLKALQKGMEAIAAEKGATTDD
jgi:hypothetical protein